MDDVKISVDAYRHLCNVLIEFVGRADAGVMAGTHFSAFVNEIVKCNPHVLPDSDESVNEDSE